MGSQLFGPLNKDSDIRVGYIDSKNGFVEGISVCKANEIAQKDPGIVFIFKSGDNKLKYLNINEVNELTTNDVLNRKESCAGVNQKVKVGPPKIEIIGGGGVGAVGNPIIGRDGSLLAVDIVRTGNGYVFQPLVSANDESDYGGGAVLTAVLGELVVEGDDLVIVSDASVTEGLTFTTTRTLKSRTGTIRGYRGKNETFIYQYYDRADDYEEYFLCDSTLIPYGRLWGPNGEDLGEWKPTSFIGGSDPILRDVQEFQRDVRALEGGFFNTRKIKPSKISSSDQNVIGGYHPVTDKTFVNQAYPDGIPANAVRWGSFMNKYAISPKPPSNAKGSDFAGTLFTFEWNLDFPTTGEYKFRGVKDNVAKLYVDNQFIADLGHFQSGGNLIKKYYEEGLHTVKIELLNKPIYETVSIDAYERQIPGVDFIQKSNGIYMTVGGNQDVDVALSFNYDDDPNNAGTAATEIIIPNSPGRPDLVLKRKKKGEDWKEKGKVTASEVFQRSEDGYGPIKFKGSVKTPKLAKRNKAYGEDSNKYGKVELFDNDGKDVNAFLEIAGTKNIQKARSKKVEKGPDVNIINTEVFNTIDWIGRSDRKLWRTNPNGGGGFMSHYGICPFDTNGNKKEVYAGTHVIRWEGIDIPADGNYDIEVAVDDNVRLLIGNNAGDGQMSIGNGLENINKGGDEVIITKRGFKPTTSSGTGKSTYTRFFKKGKYRVRAELEQIPGGIFEFSGVKGANPMALAIRITGSRTDVTRISPKSWNQNPMGVSLTIDAPEPIVPQEPPPVQEGRCPPNPLWTTRTSGAKEQWYPVTHSFPGNIRSWSDFTNRYAMSPIKPLAQEGTDGGGIVYQNSWTIDVPFEGFYGLKGTVDNGGRVLIDGNEQIAGGLGFNSTKPRLGGFKTNSPETKKIFLSKGSHVIDVEVINQTTVTYDTIIKSIFNSQEWASPAITNDFVNVDFKVTTSAQFANSIKFGSGDGGEGFSFGKSYNGSQLNEQTTKRLQAGKVYDVTFNSNLSGGSDSGARVYKVRTSGASSTAGRRVASKGKEIQFDDKANNGFDVNATLRIQSSSPGVDAKFSADGSELIVNGNGNVSLRFEWDDNPSTSGLSVGTLRIGSGEKVSATFVQRGKRGIESKTINVDTGGRGSGDNNKSSIKLRNAGERTVQMEDHKDNDWADLVVTSSAGKFFDLQGNKAKFTVGASLSPSTVRKRNGATYSGPDLFRFNHKRWSKFMNKNNVSPFLAPIDEENSSILGFFTYTWSNVNFSEGGRYRIRFQSDNAGTVFINGQSVSKNKGFIGNPSPEYINLKAGRYEIRVEVENAPPSLIFNNNPTGLALKIDTPIKVPNASQPWKTNPIGISAVLISPPCPRRIDGRGLVTDVIVENPGNGYVPPAPNEPGYPAILKLKEVLVKNPGINYNCGVDQVVVEPSNGAELDYECDAFGRIVKINVIVSGGPFTELPIIKVIPGGGIPGIPATGVNFQAVPLFEVERDPVAALTGDIPLDKLVQVTDLVGLKQTGYVDGRSYYGAVFYKGGIRYAGYFETAGQQIQVYDTLQESITAQVTTDPSAILRQGTDTNSNNQRLDIPGTPNELI
jgi:hypothetical protein